MTVIAAAFVVRLDCDVAGVSVPEGSAYLPLAVGNTWEYDGGHVSSSWFKRGVGFVKYLAGYELRSYTLK